MYQRSATFKCKDLLQKPIMLTTEYNEILNQSVFEIKYNKYSKKKK